MKALVVGAGSIGRRHLANLLRVGAATATVCDANRETADTIRRDFSVEAFTDLRRALDQGPDAVLVCTPTNEHVIIARAALAAGAHVFIEKPVAASLDGTAELVELARAKRRTVLVGCNMRFHPGVRHLKGALDAGAPRHPLYFRARFSHYLPNWRKDADYRRFYSARRQHGGGIVLEGVHEIDYLRWFGGEVATIDADVAHVSDLEIDSEDYAVLALRFKNGAIGQIHLDYLSPLKLRGCEVVGVDAMLRWTSEGKAPERVCVERYAANGDRLEVLYVNDDYDANEMYVHELEHFLDCLAGTAEPALDLEDACRVLDLALRARDQGERKA